MDYKVFYADVVDWINQCNEMATSYGVKSNEFWNWVVGSTGDISDKHGHNDLVIMQMTMLVDWIRNFCERR